MAEILWLRLQASGNVSTLAALYSRPSATAVQLLTVAQLEWQALERALQARKQREAEVRARMQQRRGRGR